MDTRHGLYHHVFFLIYEGSFATILVNCILGDYCGQNLISSKSKSNKNYNIDDAVYYEHTVNNGILSSRPQYIIKQPTIFR